MEKPQLTLDEATHTYWVGTRKLPSVTTIMSDLGLSHNFSGISSFYAQRGTAVHKAVELVDKGTLDDSTLDPRLSGYVSGYRRFLRESGYGAEYWEVPLYSESLSFAGTIDKLGTLNGRFGVLDIKTSRTLDPAVELQLCAYTLLWNENRTERPAEFKYALQLTEGGDYSLTTKYSSASIDLWVSVMDVYRWKLKHVRK